MEQQRDHIFISYAIEQAACADWLARRLAVAGYAVWYDRLQLLGGEPWPQDIDRAIKMRTHRMVALLSKEALEKPNPTGERTTAQQIAREENIPDFLIPLNITGLRATDIPWTLSPVNYISFSEGWAGGLAALLKKLDSVNTPRTLGKDGASLAATANGFPALTHKGTETLYSNCFRISEVPVAIRRYISGQDVDSSAAKVLRRRWPCRQTDKRRFLSLAPPPHDAVQQFSLQQAGGSSWRDVSEIDGMASRNVVVSLIHASVESHFLACGLAVDEKSGEWYFPDGLLSSNRLRLQNPNGSSSWRLVAGQRRFRGEAYRYYLSPSFTVRRGSDDPFVLVLRVRIRLTDLDGMALAPRKALARRKHLCRNWWNAEWLARTLAVAQFLATDGSITLGSGSSRIVVDAKPENFQVDVTIDDSSADEPDDSVLGRDQERELEADIMEHPEAEA